jgi:cobalt-precorrin-5B (C1)-methyltransferase
MARRLTELFPFKPGEPFYKALANKCYAVCTTVIPNVNLEILLIDANDHIISFEA